MNRVCIEKATGKVVEMQSGGYEDEKLRDARLDTLRKNALNAGHKEEEIEVKWATEEELEAISADLNQPTPEQIAAQEREALIQAKIREMAEAELIAEGKLAEK